MKKIIALCFLTSMYFIGFTQPLNNEWIDYNKPYYKFKLAKDGLYRINQATLNAVGLSNTPIEQFQLWRNGEQVTLFTSKSNGVLTSNDFIEFWGKINDGKMDRLLYPNPAHQLSDKLSLLTDSSTYFLTVNPNVAQNLRYTKEDNNALTSSLPVEPYFFHTLRFNYKDRVNRGYSLSAGGESIYSSSYEEVEILGTNDINNSGFFNIPLSNLYVANVANQFANLSIGIAGNAPKNRTINIYLNNSKLSFKQSTIFNGFRSTILNKDSISLSSLNGTNDVASIEVATSDAFDRVIASFFELKYPRLFNFNNQSNFEFTIPASTNGNLLEITNFNIGNTLPLLYDINNNIYYEAITTTSNTLKFALAPSTSSTNFILASRDQSNINNILTLEKREFIDFNKTSNQADYIIISGKALTRAGTAVEDFKNYRNSKGFNAKIYDADELADQFSFGVKKHPFSIKNFIRFATSKFSVKPQNLFMIGKAYTYDQVRVIETKSKSYQDSADLQDIVPTYGWPASDALLVSSGFTPSPLIAFGRLAAINNTEVLHYLDKVKLYETQANSGMQTIANKAWMKQLMHVAGAEDGLAITLTNVLKEYESIARDTFFGASPAILLSKTSGSAIDISTNDVAKYFQDGMAHITYYGHSAASSLAFNLNNPEDYNNYGKYPNFLAMGCSAGNFFDYDPLRFVKPTSLAERFVLIKDKGSISFIASTHFGFVGYLDVYGRGFYNSFVKNDYGKSIGINMLAACNYYKSVFGVNNWDPNNLVARIHAEQFVLHGDPAIKIYTTPKPDFVVEDPQVKINPTFISILSNSFSLKANILNLGKATGDSVRLLVKRTYPNGNSVEIINKNISSIRYNDTSVNINIPINAATDKGNNSITISIDSDNKYDELSESNNSITKQFFIFEDEIKPIFPANYSIINKSNIKLAASTANVFVANRQYILEFDTTTLFNSSFKISKTINSTGGLLEFDPSFTLKDSTVYYWRVAIVPNSGNYNWTNSSFIYLQNATTSGFNQSHFYQHCESTKDKLQPDSAKRVFEFIQNNGNITINNCVYPFNERIGVAVNDELNVKIAGSCWRTHNINFNVFSNKDLSVWKNTTQGAAGQFGSQAIPSDCVSPVTYDFSFTLNDTSGRNAAMRFMENNIPNGSFVVVRPTLLMYRDANNNVIWGNPALVDIWQQDAVINGNGKSLYNSLKNVGFNDIDSFNKIRSFIFVYQKNNGNFIPVSRFSVDSSDVVNLRAITPTKSSIASITSPSFGPVTKWYNMIWKGTRNDLQDVVDIKLLGIKNNGIVDTLATYTEFQLNNDISTINATTYPYLKILMNVRDIVNLSAYQLNYWRLLGDILPEGGIMPITINFKDTLQKGQLQDVSIAFKNVSTSTYTDSIPLRMSITNNSNVINNINVPKLKKLAFGEVDTIKTTINSAGFVGNNTFYINVNPSNNPQEQTLTNNLAFKNFFVIEDVIKPILDVTFDGTHILNNDVVSSKPNIRISLKDESKYMLLNDTSSLNIKLKHPNGDIIKYNYDNNILKFIPATNNGANNAITEFNPQQLEDGEYELYVVAKDKSGNESGTQQYRVMFTVNNKPAISQLLNYPNPFTTSTSFVFTITGSEIPQNFKIQILTVTGKIVKEITRQELGDIRIGRNITDYKWDGTDMFGQPLGNGVYLYRVVTSIGGKALDKYNPKDANGNEVNIDKYFKEGYGKMYLMR